MFQKIRFSDLNRHKKDLLFPNVLLFICITVDSNGRVTYFRGVSYHSHSPLKITIGHARYQTLTSFSMFGSVYNKSDIFCGYWFSNLFSLCVRTGSLPPMNFVKKTWIYGFFYSFLSESCGRQGVVVYFRLFRR